MHASRRKDIPCTQNGHAGNGQEGQGEVQEAGNQPVSPTRARPCADDAVAPGFAAPFADRLFAQQVGGVYRGILADVLVAMILDEFRNLSGFIGIDYDGADFFLARRRFAEFRRDLDGL